MFVFKIKDNSTAIDIVVTRALLALAAIVALVYRTGDNFWINFIIAMLLFISSAGMKILLLRFRVDKLLITGIAAVLLFFATHSVGFAIVLVGYAAIVKVLYQQPAVQVSKEGLQLKKMIVSNHYEWSSFANVVLKDRLLTLDFTNNKLLQLDIDESSGLADEAAFNNFCRQCLIAAGE